MPLLTRYRATNLNDVLTSPFEVNWDSPQAQGLIGWWPTVGRVGAAYLWDMLGGNHGATFVNSPLWKGVAQLGMALQFNGLTGGNANYVQLQRQIFGGLSQASLSLWYYPIAQPSSSACVFWESTTSSGYTRFAVYHGANSNNMILAARDTATGSAYTITDTGGIPAGSWYHILGTYDSVSDDMVLYRNGSNVGTNTTAKGALQSGTPADPVTIGAFIAVSKFAVNGFVADVRAWNQVVIPTVAWQLWDPATRWDLYRPLRRYWVLKLPVGWAFNPVYDGRGIIGSNVVRGAK